MTEVLMISTFLAWLNIYSKSVINLIICGSDTDVSASEVTKRDL